MAIWPASFSRRTTRASDEPIRPMPTRAIFSNSGCGMALSFSGIRPARRRRRDWPLRCRRSCAARWENHSRRRAAGCSRARDRKSSASAAECFSSSGKWISTKLPTLGVTRRPSFASSSVSQRSQWSLCATVRSTWARSRKRGDAGLDRGGVDVERPAHAVDRVDDVRRRVHPADAQRRRGHGSSRRCGSSRRSRASATSSTPAS